MSRKRRVFTVKFKVKVAMEAFTGVLLASGDRVQHVGEREGAGQRLYRETVVDSEVRECVLKRLCWRACIAPRDGEIL